MIMYRDLEHDGSRSTIIARLSGHKYAIDHARHRKHNDKIWSAIVLDLLNSWCVIAYVAQTT